MILARQPEPYSHGPSPPSPVLSAISSGLPESRILQLRQRMDPLNPESFSHILNRVMQTKEGKGDMNQRDIEIGRDVNLIKLSQVKYYHFRWGWGHSWKSSYRRSSFITAK
jgi:hypothetical protein